MTNVTKFPGFNAHPGPLAIPAQITERVQAAKQAGLEVHVSAVVATKQPSGNWTYATYWDAQPIEIMAWAIYQLDQRCKDTDLDTMGPPTPVAG